MLNNGHLRKKVFKTKEETNGNSNIIFDKFLFYEEKKLWIM